MVLPDTQHIFDKEALIKPKAQDRPKVFNLVVAKKNGNRNSRNFRITIRKFNITVAISIIDSCHFINKIFKQ